MTSPGMAYRLQLRGQGAPAQGRRNRRARRRARTDRTSRRRDGEGYPEAAGSVPAGFLFHGALSTYEKLGFVRDRKIGKHRWVVTKVVEPTS